MRAFLFSVFVVSLFGFAGCNEPVKADFELLLDPNMPGKVNVVNMSHNANVYEWQVWLKSSENGTPYQSSIYGSSLTSSEENPSFYIQEETWIEVELRAVNSFLESTESKSIEVANIPDSMIVGNLIITDMDLRDADGYEWDDFDGMPDFGDYSNTNAFPDLIVNTSLWSTTYSDGDVQEWNVNIETGLPYTMFIDPEVYDNLGPQTDDVVIEVVDFDGPQGSIFAGPAKRIGYHRFNPYHLTHKYNKGSESNYPSVYHIETDHFEGDLYLTWQ